MELFGFDESRYITNEKETELRESFKLLNPEVSNQNIQEIRENIEEELKETYKDFYESQLNLKDDEIRKLKAENPEKTVIINQFRDFINSTKKVVEKLENAHSLKCVFFKVSRAEIVELYPENLRHLI